VSIKNYFPTTQNLNVIWGYNKDPKLIFIGKCNQKVFLEPKEQKIIQFAAMPLQGGFVKLPRVRLQKMDEFCGEILKGEFGVLRVG
jgi:hypothetical protein